MGQPQPARGREGCLEEKCASLDNGVTHLVSIKDSATSQFLSGGFHSLEQVRETPQEKGGKADNGTEWAEACGKKRGRTAFLRPLLSGRDDAGHREWRREPCLVREVDRSADLCHTE